MSIDLASLEANIMMKLETIDLDSLEASMMKPVVLDMATLEADIFQNKNIKAKKLKKVYTATIAYPGMLRNKK